MWDEISKILKAAHEDLSGGTLTEQSTKQFLIEPILTVLGWNLAAPTEVQREYKKVVDYALFGERLTLYLEAKRLGIALDSAMQQVLNYAIQKDTKPDFVITTDGLIWNCVSMRYQTALFSVNLSQLDTDQRAQFELLSRKSVDAGALTNYANQARTEQEVLDYLKRNAGRIGDDINSYDTSFDRENVVNYLTALASRSHIVVKTGKGRSQSQSKVAMQRSGQVEPSSSYSPSPAAPRTSQSWTGEYDINLLSRDYLVLVAGRLGEIESSEGEKLYVRFGITGKWETPNYQVESASGTRTWTFRGKGRFQRSFGVSSFNRSKITYKRYSREDILKVLE